MTFTLSMRILVLAFLVTLISTSIVLGQGDLKDLLTNQDWDQVIKKTESALLQAKGDERKSLLSNEAWAYFKKAKLLLSAYSLSLELDSMYYSCRGKEQLKNDKYLLYCEGIVLALKGNYQLATGKFNDFLKKNQDASYSNKASIWVGLLAEKLGKSDMQFKFWKDVTWDESLSLERFAIAHLLQIKNSTYDVKLPNELTNQSFVRNISLVPSLLKQCSLDDKKKMLAALKINAPLIDYKKGNSHELFYDPLVVYSFAKCALRISGDLLEEYFKILNDNDKNQKSYSEVRFSFAEILYLSSDYENAERVLSSLQQEKAPALLGAVKYIRGATQEASSLWSGVENGKSKKAQSYLVSIYSSLGVNLTNAKMISDRILRESNGGTGLSQEDIIYLASIYERLKNYRVSTDTYVMGYRMQFDGKINSKYGNDAEYVLKYCTSLELVDRNGVFNVNVMLKTIRDKYSYVGIMLHDLATSFSSCIDPNSN